MQLSKISKDRALPIEDSEFNIDAAIETYYEVDTKTSTIRVWVSAWSNEWTRVYVPVDQLLGDPARGTRLDEAYHWVEAYTSDRVRLYTRECIDLSEDPLLVGEFSWAGESGESPDHLQEGAHPLTQHLIYTYIYSLYNNGK